MVETIMPRKSLRSDDGIFHLPVKKGLEINKEKGDPGGWGG